MSAGEHGSEDMSQPDERARASTLDLVEEMIGCELDVAEAERLGGAPDEQLGYFLEKFASFWYDWFERRAVKGKAVSGKPIYLASGVGPDANPGMSLADYKRVALFFDEIGVADPLAGALHGAVETANLTGEISIEWTHRGFRAGLLRLAEIAPLVRSGAFVLVPDAFCSLHPLTQELARKELGRASPEEEEYPARFDRDRYAIAVALAATAEAWPIATTTGVFERMERGVMAMATAGRAVDLEIGKAMAKFGLPDASVVPIDLLVRIREDESNILEFRRKLSCSLARARVLAEDDPKLFAEFLDDELRSAAERSRDAIRMSSSLDGAVAPALAALLLAATKFGFGGAIDLADPLEIAKLSAEVAVPGAAWLLAQITRRFASPQVRRTRRLAELYGCLVKGGSDVT
jgi:hypothetical protein